METGIINIAGEEVNVAYCYATEIAFRKYTNMSIEQFDAQNPEHVLYFVISAIVAWSQYKGEEPAIKDEQLMYNAKPKELVEALSVIFKLRMKWYDIPEGEPVDDNSEAGEKNG